MVGWGVAACACCLSGMVFPASYYLYMTFQELELKDEILLTPKLKLVNKGSLPQSDGKAVRVKDLRNNK